MNKVFDSKKFFSKMFLSNKNEYPNVLYIHSPFCNGTCNYCKYSGININMSDDGIIEKYYNEDFLNEINKFGEIFNEVVFDEIYFGGGTVNFSDNPMYLENMIKNIPNFNRIKKKSIELHPYHINEKYLNIIQKYNFDYVSIGIQSLDEQTCINENRYYCSYNKLINIINKLKNIDVFINIDIIINLKFNNVKDSFKDLNKILELSPNSITIQPNCYYDYTPNEFLEIYGEIKNYLERYNNYVLINQKLDSKSFIEDYKFHQKYGVEYRIVNVNKKFYEHYIYSKKKSNDFYNYNVLGIGYAEGHSKNHAISFTNDIFFDSSDNTIFTLPEDEKISTIESQQLLRELIQYYIKKCD